MDYLQNGNKVRLTEPIGNLENVGETYEIGAITETAYIIRDEKTKIALIAVNFDLFDKHFEKESKSKKMRWTNWKGILNGNGDLFMFYRTNGKRVQVKTLDEKVKAESSCNSMDSFDLKFGIYLAALRCNLKMGEVMKGEGYKIIKENKDKIDELLKEYDKIRGVK